MLKSNLLIHEQEAVDTSGKLKLSDEVDALQALLYYVYHGTYSDSFCIDGRKMAFAVRVYGIADFYQLGQLRDFATAELEKILEPATIDDHMDFFTAVHFAEERSNPNDSSIRNMLFDALKTNLEELVQKEDFSNFISQHPELNMRLLSALADATSHPTRGDRKRRASPVSSFPSRSKWGYSAGNYIDTDDSE